MVSIAGSICGERAVLSLANSLGLRGVTNESDRGRAAHVEGGDKAHADGLDVLLGDTEGGRSKSNLGDEVGVLSVAEVHELMGRAHGWVTHVGGETILAVLGALQESTEERVKVGEEEAVSGQ